MELYIKNVAIYLRKSRGDIDTDLEKHRKVLVELCKENKWRYIEYVEIGSGDSIFMRPVFQKLLTDVESEIFDAVCVMDIDRLGRGDMGDQDKIKKCFSNSDTLVITPQQIYNLNNDDDEFVVEMKGFIARREYKQILKRLSQGKKIGARMGMWTNGTPPYPYEYQKWKDKHNEKGLVINDDKLSIYRKIVDSIINDNKTPRDIAIELNINNIPAPKGNVWHGVTIHRLLKDETHLGKIITNKTKGDGHKNKNPNAKKLITLPKEEWITVENCHESCKTKEEHNQILLFLSRNTTTPKRKSTIVKPLSGLIRCARCGHTMTLLEDNNRKSEIIKPCWYVDSQGNKCNNRGMKISILYDYILQDILKYEKILREKIQDDNFLDSSKVLINDIKFKEKELENKKNVLARILDAFEAGAYNIQEFKERKLKAELQIQKINDEIELLKISMESTETILPKLERINLFIQNIDKKDITTIMKNNLYKSIIDHIKWLRIDDNVNIELVYK